MFIIWSSCYARAFHLDSQQEFILTRHLSSLELLQQVTLLLTSVHRAELPGLTKAKTEKIQSRAPPPSCVCPPLQGYCGDPCSESLLSHLGLKSFKYDFTSYLQSIHSLPLSGKKTWHHQTWRKRAHVSLGSAGRWRQGDKNAWRWGHSSALYSVCPCLLPLWMRKCLFMWFWVSHKIHPFKRS